MIDLYYKLSNFISKPHLRKLSAKHLRNSCILYHVKSGQNDKEMQRYFHFTHPFSLHRYKDFIKQEGGKYVFKHDLIKKHSQI